MKPIIIGICGGSGSGKTTFIKQLKQSFSDTELCVISQDDYYRPRNEQVTDDQGVANFDLPKSIDKKAFISDINRLIGGETIEKPEYTFNNADAIPVMKVFKPAPLIVVEGIFIFHFKKIRKLLDLKIFLHAKENLKVIRRIKRDQVERGYPIEDVLYRYEKHVMPTFEKFILPYQEKADLIVNNNDHFDNSLGVIIGYMKSMLTKNGFE